MRSGSGRTVAADRLGAAATTEIPKRDFRISWSCHAPSSGDRRIGVEFKRVHTPLVTPSMRIAMQDLRLDALYVVHPGRHRFRMAEGIEAVLLWGLLPAR